MSGICETVTSGWPNGMNITSLTVMTYWPRRRKNVVLKCCQSHRRLSFSMMWKDAGHITENGIVRTGAKTGCKMRKRRRIKHRQLAFGKYRRLSEHRKTVPRPKRRQDVIEQTLPFEDMDFTQKKKRCPYCGKVLPLNLFNLSRKAKDGRQPYCRACQRRYKEEHPDVEYKYKHNNIGTLQIRW